MAGFESRLTDHRRDMELLAAQLREADRIEGLDERPPLPFVEPDLNTPAGIEVDPRRFVPAFISVEARVRAAAVED